MVYAILAVLFAGFFYFEVRDILAMWRAEEDELWNANSVTHTKLVNAAKSEDAKSELARIAAVAENAINNG